MPMPVHHGENAIQRRATSVTVARTNMISVVDYSARKWDKLLCPVLTQKFKLENFAKNKESSVLHQEVT